MTDEEIQRWTEAIARESGEVLLSFFGKRLTRNIKSHTEDFATEADLAAEELIINAIQQRFPDDDILSEEAGFVGTQNAEHTWIIDPLDGTWNFANGIPEYGTMITRADGEQIQLAVIYNPASDHLASGRRECGTEFNGVRVQAATVSSLSACHPIVGWMPQAPSADRINRIRQKLSAQGLSTKSLRSVAANTMSIVRGERDAYIGNAFKPWDFAPMDLLLREAGFCVTDFSRVPLSWKRGDQDFVVAPPQLFDEIMLYCIDGTH